jgi:hypothetical protein
VVRLGFLLGLFVIRGPARFSPGSGSKERRERGDGENSAQIFHTMNLGQTKSLRKLSRNTRSARFRYNTSPAAERRAKKRIGKSYLMCPETSLVISNMLTWLLPLKTGLSESSALIMVLFFLSWHPFFLM